jgi:N-methylhydantoinase B
MTGNDKRAVDPITLTVFWNSLISIADEMGGTLQRTAFSEAVREGEDFSAGIFDRHARLIAQGNFTPGHLGAMPYVVRSVLEYIPPETLVPGDTLVTNDSFLGGGHYPDFYMTTPVFDGDDLIGYVVNTAHHVDVGGAWPGSQAVQGVTEAFQEGIRILPVKIVKKGEFDEDLLRVILGNVRLPDKVMGDLRAQRNANHVGVQRLCSLFDTYGAATAEAIIEEILDRSEKRMRQSLGQIPDGTYSFDDCMDDYGPGTEPVDVCVDVTIKGENAVVDFSRSSGQVKAGINSYINYTRAYSMFAVKVFSGGNIPHNDGVERPIEITAREGSFFNPIYPAAGGGRATVQIRIFDAINGALSQVLPNKAMGAFTHWANPNFGGVNDKTGQPWVMYDLVFGGFGGRADTDGPEALCPVFNCANIPIEVHEANNPVRIRRLELIPDSGGAGKFRGGCGMRKDVEILSDNSRVTLLGDRHVHPPYGMFGGAPGRLAETILNPDTDAIALGSKEVRALKRGDVVSFRLAGAGGYGEARHRDPAKIRKDVRDGYVSEAAARETYKLGKDTE